MSFNETYATFNPPPLTSLNFTTNCTLVGLWSAAWFVDQDGIDDITAETYFRNALPSSMQKVPSRGQIIDWMSWAQWYYAQNNTLTLNKGINMFYNKTLDEPRVKCPIEFCRGLAWSGDPDVTGIGILISYYIQAALVSIFAIFLTLDYIFITRHRQPSWFTNKYLKKFLDALKASLQIFIDTNQLFSVAFIIASIRAATPPPVAESQLFLSNDMAFFTLTTVNLLKLVSMFAFGDTAETRNGPFLLLIALCLISSVLTGVMSSKLKPSVWEIDCGVSVFSNERLTTRILYSLYMASIIGAAFVFSIIPRILKKREGGSAGKVKAWAQGNKRWMYIFMTVVFGLSMWGYLINVTATRQRIKVASGRSDEDTKWTFGQVVALCTWFPIGAEIFYLMWNGVHETMKDRVVSPYIVTKDENWSDPRIPSVQNDDTSETGIERRPTEQIHQAGASDDQIELLTRVHGDSLAVQDDANESVITRNSSTTFGAPSAEELDHLPPPNVTEHTSHI